MIKATVFNPIWRGEDIAWLAFESMCAQQYVNFNWELIIHEEVNEDNVFGFDNISAYTERLKEVGCSRIIYVRVPKKIPLVKKLQLAGNMADPNSKIFIFQSADCYSQPNRFKESYELLLHMYDYVSSYIGPVYNIYTDETFIYDFGRDRGVTGLNIAVQTKHVRSLPDTNLTCGIDGWFRDIAKSRYPKFKDGYNESINWKYGLDTHGLNKISTERFLTKKFLVHYNFDLTRQYKIDECIPKYIMDTLRELKEYCEYGLEINKSLWIKKGYYNNDD